MYRYIRQLQQYRYMNGQQGAMLVVVLIILLIVSMLGMTTMDTTGLEMRMASNTRDQQSAFEAAEYGLSMVADSIRSQPFSDAQHSNGANGSNCGDICFDATCTNGYCFQGTDGHIPIDGCTLDGSATPPGEDPDVWNTSTRHQTLDTPGGITVMYTIELRCYGPLTGTEMTGGNFAPIYRITAAAVGNGGRGRAMLRAVIK